MHTTPDCLFCKIIAGTVPSKKVYEDDELYAFRDINSQAPTHILIIPKQHIPSLNDLDISHTQLAGQLLLAAKKIAAAEGIAEAGYRVAMNCNKAAGQTVFHLHLHLLGGRDLSWPPG